MQKLRSYFSKLIRLTDQEWTDYADCLVKERYYELVNLNSKHLQEIPQYMMASYLGIEPEPLRRIKARK